MSRPVMTVLLCTIHAKHYAFETEGGEAFECPRCARESMQRLMDLSEKAIRERDALLAAIEIKRLHQPAGEMYA